MTGIGPARRRIQPVLGRLLRARLRVAAWGLLGVLTIVLARAGDALAVPTPALFSALVVGVTFALAAPVPLGVPRSASIAAQAAIGVIVGAYLQRPTLLSVAAHWPLVLGVCCATLVLSLVAGLLLARITRLDRATASFGMIAGGAAGIVAISRSLGADDRLVALLQYLRVLIVVATTPLIALVVFGAGSSEPPAAHEHLLSGIALFALCGVTGVLAARLLRLPAGATLGPMAVAAVVSASGIGFTSPLPAGLSSVALAVIGLDVGLRFSRSTLRSARSVLPAAAAITFAIAGISALMGLVLASATGLSRLDGYLATTPGGLSAVLALALGSRANTTFILSVQVVRTVLMLLAAPPLAHYLSRGRGEYSP